MARLVAGFASSHSVMLTSTLQDWLRGFRTSDLKGRFHDRMGRAVSYSELLAMAPPDAASLVTDDAITRRFHEVQGAMARMREEIIGAGLDVLVISGDDQTELFNRNVQPALAIYYGPDVLNGRKKDVLADDWFKIAQNGRLEDVDGVRFPVDGELAKHFIKGLVERDFDVTALAGTDPGKYIGHAFSFIRKIYLDGTGIPMVPIFLNTHYEPNQITPRRCIQVGQALRQLIDDYPADARVGFMASGGLSHFQVEEDLDGVVIEALKKKDLRTLGSLEVARLKSGSSEIRNWLVLAGMFDDLEADWMSYTPGYRTEALTGTALAFATWYPATGVARAGPHKQSSRRETQ